MSKSFLVLFFKKELLLFLVSQPTTERTMADFHQDAPKASNRFRTDRALRLGLQRLLPEEIFADASASLDQLGERAVTQLAALGETAETNPPKLTPFDAWGRRIDRIDVSPAFDRLIAIGQEVGLVALPYEAPYGAHSRIVQAGLINLFEPVTAVASCPLTMTDGAAWLLKKHDPALAARYLPKLTARHGGWTSGQWMTEKEGGSDVSRTATIAEPNGDGTFRLTGTKWFTSATSADISLALARPAGAEPGSAALSLFLLELRAPDGGWNNIRVRRLKDKMGTKALPTAELELEGAIAVPVGGLGRGVAKIASVLNIARLWAALAGPACVGHLLDLARDYAQRREVFGKPLNQHPMHTAWLAQITAEYEAMIGLCLETAAAVGRAEHGGNSSLARLLTPLTKLSCARQGIWGTSELIESFGGAGYIEDTGLPRIFRNTHVHAIWEGTTNVLAHDVLRALNNRAIGEEWLDMIGQRLAATTHAELHAVTPRITVALERLRPMVLAPEEADGRRIAQAMARVTQAAILAQAAQWRLHAHHDRSAVIAAELFTRTPLIAETGSDLALGTLAYGRADGIVPAQRAA
jgi:alkylation response protein AidB-like acyl-CoA dehydrogenase